MPWWEKDGITLGMGMTEKQGGTDVRANTTTAMPAADGYTITGHKWFMSAPMCDAFLVLAQAPGGLTCFLMPRFRPDGSVNGLRFQRLKDKLGNRSNASSEVEFADAFAWRVGEEGRGVRTIIEMVQLTRVDCVISSAGMMRMALAQALHHARHRTVFQKQLADQPMMRTLLADMALEVEGATALMMRLCRSFDLAASDANEAARARLLTPAVKYWVCKTAPGFIYEAMECLGGNGYVEETHAGAALPRGAGQRDLGRLGQRDVPRRAARALARGRGGARGARRSGGACAGFAGRQGGRSVHREDLDGGRRRGARRAPRSNGWRCWPPPPRLPKARPPSAEAFARTRLAAPRGGTFGTADLATGEVASLLDRALAGRLRRGTSRLCRALIPQIAAHRAGNAMEHTMTIQSTDGGRLCRRAGARHGRIASAGPLPIGNSGLKAAVSGDTTEIHWRGRGGWASAPASGSDWQPARWSARRSRRSRMVTTAMAAMTAAMYYDAPVYAEPYAYDAGLSGTGYYGGYGYGYGYGGCYHRRRLWAPPVVQRILSFETPIGRRARKPAAFLCHERDRDRHRGGGEHRLDGEDLRHQRRIAAELARQDVGIRRGRHGRAAGDHREVRAGQAERQRDADRDRRHHDELQRAGRQASAASAASVPRCAIPRRRSAGRARATSGRAHR